MKHTYQSNLLFCDKENIKLNCPYMCVGRIRKRQFRCQIANDNPKHVQHNLLGLRFSPFNVTWSPHIYYWAFSFLPALSIFSLSLIPLTHFKRHFTSYVSCANHSHQTYYYSYLAFHYSSLSFSTVQFHGIRTNIGNARPIASNE